MWPSIIPFHVIYIEIVTTVFCHLQRAQITNGIENAIVYVDGRISIEIIFEIFQIRSSLVASIRITLAHYSFNTLSARVIPVIHQYRSVLDKIFNG